MIDQQDIFNKIGVILEEVNEQYAYLSKQGNQIEALEMELFAANTHFLKDHAQLLTKLIAQQQLQADLAAAQEAATQQIKPLAAPVVSEDYATTSEAAQSSLAEEAKVQETPRITPSWINEEEELSDTFEFETKAVNTLFDRDLTDKEQEVLQKVKEQSSDSDEAIPTLRVEESIEEEGPEPFLIHAVEEEEIEESIESVASIEPIALTPSPEPIAEEAPLFTPIISLKSETIETEEVAEPSEVKKTLNELLAAQSTHNAAPAPAIKDLRQAINLNQKLLFIRTLFNGYNLAYSEAIDLVNRMHTYEEAESFLLKNYAEKNQWVNKTETVDEFLVLIQRRFQS